MADAPDRSAVLACLEKIEASKGFRRSERMKRFLRYVVEKTLDGQQDQLREFNLGVDVYDRGAMFDPSVDNIVRVDANRLRGKLAGYYSSDGAGDSLVIDLPKGAYVATFLPAGPRREPAPPPTVSRRTIAIMPFRSRTDPELAETITDEAASALASERRLRIAARSAAARFRERDYDPQAAAAELNAGVLLEGRLRPIDSCIRVDAELVDAADGLQLWSSRFDIDPTAREIDVMAQRIAAAVRSTLLDSDSAIPGGESSALCERGFRHLRALTVDEIDKAIATFETSRRADPESPTPYRGLALSRAALAEAGLADDLTILERAETEARKAVELAETDSAARATLGFIETLRRNWTPADESTRLAVSYDRESTEARLRRGFFLQARGRFADAAAQLETALALDASDERALTSLGWILYCQRDFDSALQKAHAAAYLDSRHAPAHLLAAAASTALGASDEAEASCREALLIRPQDPWARALVGDAHDPSLSKVTAAAVRLRGDAPAALDLLEQAIEESDPQLLKLRWPLFDPLRSAPRFERIATRIFGE